MAQPRPHRTWPWALMAFVLLLVLAALPVSSLLSKRSAAADADQYADELTTARRAIVPADSSGNSPSAPASDSPGDPASDPPAATGLDSADQQPAPLMPVLRIDRAGELLTTATQQYALTAAISSAVQAWTHPNCLSIRQNGSTLIGINDEQLLVPASVQKLLTAAGILDHLDLNERLVTRVLSNARPVNGVLEGDIWIVGAADPLISTGTYAASHSRQPQLYSDINELVSTLQALPITTIRGRIIGDESRHDTTRYVESWPYRYRSQFNIGPLSSLTVNDGLTSLGYAPTIATDPALEFVKLVGDLLLVRGVSLDVSYETGLAPAAESADVFVLAELRSPRVSEMVRQLLRESDNNTAEILLREVGLRTQGVGSTQAGAAAVTQTVSDLLAGMQPAVEPVVVIDGSGLDRGNLVSCAQLTELLDSYGQDSIVGEGLPVAGRSGTLSHRFRGDDAQGVLSAKTGLLTGVNALAGFLETPTGTFTFAQILNGVPRGTRVGIDAQEELVEILLQHPVDCTAAQVALAAPWSGSVAGDQAQGDPEGTPTCVWVLPEPPEPDGPEPDSPVPDSLDLDSALQDSALQDGALQDGASSANS